MESLLTSHSTFLFNQMNFMTSQGAIKASVPNGGNSFPQSSREILYTFGRRSSFETYMVYGILVYGICPKGICCLYMLCGTMS